MKINFTGWIEVPDDLDDRGSVDQDLVNTFCDECEKYEEGVHEEPGEMFAALHLTWEVAP